MPCAVAALALTAGTAAGQHHGHEPDSVTVIPGARYAAGSLQRFLLGEDYRDLWTTPIEVPVLDLRRVAGGLKPVRTGGQVQTKALRFEGADGREYNFRSVDKELTPALPPYAQETLLDWVRQDQTRAQVPVAPVVATALLDAVGVLNPGPRLVVLPDDPALGEFRAEFAGILGTFEVHPQENEEDPEKGFAGAERVAGTDRLLEHLEEDGPAHRVDTRAFLKARLMDVFLGDWDRHEGQWRWASDDRDGIRWWVPIPEDRDYAFADYDGFLLAVAQRIGIARLVQFEERYANLLAMMDNSLELNRRLLADLPRSVWDSTAVDLQARLTDEVIREALRTMPRPHYERYGPHLERILVARRDGLRAMATEYYETMAQAVEIHASDLDERAEIRRAADGTVTVRLLGPVGEEETLVPFYDRTFLPGETDEVRVHLHGGDDAAELSGAGGPIVVRVIGGGDDDVLEDRSGGPTAFYDDSGENRFVRGPRTRVETRLYEPPVEEDGLLPTQSFDWGEKRQGFAAWADWDSHAGPVIGGGPAWTRYGFRHHPIESRQAVRLLYAPLETRLGAEFRGVYRRENSERRLEVLLRASAIEATRFHGFGNATPDLPDDLALAWERELALHFDWVFPFAEEVTLRAGPRLRYIDSDLPASGAAGEPRPFGSGGLGQAVGRLALAVDTRDDGVFPRSGVNITANSDAGLALTGDGKGFGRVEGRGSAFLPLGGPAAPVVVLRAGGARALGDFPFYDAAFLGGSRSLRGYSFQRFAGDAALFGTTEVRAPLTTAEIIVRGRLGVSAFADAGRVFVDGESDGDWHTGIGGGVWFATPLVAISLNYAHGDRGRLYLQLGMPQ